MSKKKHITDEYRKLKLAIAENFRTNLKGIKPTANPLHKLKGRLTTTEEIIACRIGASLERKIAEIIEKAKISLMMMESIILKE